MVGNYVGANLETKTRTSVSYLKIEIVSIPNAKNGKVFKHEHASEGLIDLASKYCSSEW